VHAPSVASKRCVSCRVRVCVCVCVTERARHCTTCAPAPAVESALALSSRFFPQTVLVSAAGLCGCALSSCTTWSDTVSHCRHSHTHTLLRALSTRPSTLPLPTRNRATPARASQVPVLVARGVEAVGPPQLQGPRCVCLSQCAKRQIKTKKIYECVM
jgi:hypothetical protein